MSGLAAVSLISEEGSKKWKEVPGLAFPCQPHWCLTCSLSGIIISPYLFLGWLAGWLADRFAMLGTEPGAFLCETGALP